MEFPSKPFDEVLDIPPPAWATHQIDFITDFDESCSVYVAMGVHQYFRTTNGGLMGEPSWDEDGWTIEDWRDVVKDCPYFNIIDLTPIEENE